MKNERKVYFFFSLVTLFYIFKFFNIDASLSSVSQVRQWKQFALEVSLGSTLFVLFASYCLYLKAVVKIKQKLNIIFNDRMNKESRDFSLKVEHVTKDINAPLKMIEEASFISSCLVDNNDVICWSSNEFLKSFNLLEIDNVCFSKLLSFSNIVNTTNLTKNDGTIQLSNGTNLHLKIKNIKDFKFVEFIPSFNQSIQNLPTVWCLNEAIEEVSDSLGRIYLGVGDTKNKLIFDQKINLIIPQDLLLEGMSNLLKAVYLYVNQNEVKILVTRITQVGAHISTRIELVGHRFCDQSLNLNLLENKTKTRPLKSFMKEFESKTEILSSEISIKNVRTSKGNTGVIEVSFQNSLVKKKLNSPIDKMTTRKEKNHQKTLSN